MAVPFRERISITVDNTIMEKENILISECLLGIKCRMDGQSKPLPDETIAELMEKYYLIPVCPEILGGLPTPRDPSEIRNGRVISNAGKDVTAEFERGAEEVLKLAQLYKVKKAIFKEKSPSCGSGRIYDGTFQKIIVSGDGVTAKLLKENGIEILGENQLCQEI